MSQARPDADVPLFADGDRVAIAASSWNERIVSELLRGCDGRLRELGAAVDVVRVPGAYELPTAAKWLAECGQFAAVVCLGCVIRGDTPHFDYVAGECARGLTDVALATGVPTLFGVLTVNTEQQALDRAGGEHGHAGISAADAAAQMVAVRRKVEAMGQASSRSGKFIEIERQLGDQLDLEAADRRSGDTGGPIPVVKE